MLSLKEAATFPHNESNQTFMMTEDFGYEPSPSPILSRTPAINNVRSNPQLGQHTIEILKEFDYTNEEIKSFLAAGVVEQLSSKL